MITYNNSVNRLYLDTEGIKAGGKKDYLSLLPTDILKIIMKNLPIGDVRSLKITGSNIRPAAESMILIKIQEFLEDLERDLLENVTVIRDIKEKPSIYEEYCIFNERAKTVPYGSEERCQALRDAICVIFDKCGLAFCSSSFKYADWLLSVYRLYKDKQLASQVVKNLGDDGPRICFSNLKKGYLKTISLYMDLLEQNQLKPKCFYLVTKNTLLDEKIINMFLRAIKENEFITEVDLGVSKWNPLHLKMILKAIKNNKRINKIVISEEFYWGCENYSWLKNKKRDKHISTLGEIIFKELGNTEFVRFYTWVLER